MRVLHLGKYMAPHPGGIERFLAELLPAQRRAGVLTAALVHAEDRAGARRCRFQAHSAVIRAPVLATLAYTPVSPGWPIRLQRLITRWQPDLLHLHLPNPSAFWALASPAARAIPWVVHWHADVPADALDARLRVLYRLYRPLEHATLERAGTIIATSAAYADSSAPLRPWRSKVAVVPLGMADQSPASPEPGAWPPGTAQRLLFVGRFSYYKGLEHLIDAMALLPADTTLRLVGSGAQRESIERRTAALGLADRVVFAGALSDADLARAYATADVLCLPSIERSEAFGMVLLEAMRAGVPSIATGVRGSGMASVIGDGEAGFVVAPGQPAALAEAIRQLRDDPEGSRRFRRDGRARFLREFQIDRIAAKLSDLYRELLLTR
jgi:glycosyltransferase involved in cell wall biosynthesis